MDVRCGLCGTEYDFDDALISERGTTVQCTECGFQFKVYPEQPLSGVERWIVRSGSGAGWEREYTSLKDLQQAIQQGDVGPADLLSRGGSEPRPLAAIAELEPLFRQRVVRSGGTLLGMMPGPGAGPGAVGPPGAEPHVPSAEATSGRRRVATKLGLPMAPVPAPISDGGPPPATPPAVTPPPVFDEPKPAPEQASPTASHTLARTLPSAVTPSPVADRTEAHPRHPSAPRQRIVSLLSAGEEESVQPPSRDKYAWAAQTLPSTPHGAAPVAAVAGEHAGARAEVPGPNENASAQGSRNLDAGSATAASATATSATATSASATSAATASAATANPMAGVGAAGGAVATDPAARETGSVARASEAVVGRPVAARDLDEPEIVIPARRGGARWAVGAVALAAGAAALWGWSRAADSGADPDAARGTQPNVAAAETVPAQAAAQPDAPSADRTSPSTEATEEPPAGSETVELRAATAHPADASPQGTTAPKASKGAVDYRTRLSGASAALRSGDLARAQGLYEAVLRDQPGNVEATSGLAEVAQRRGQTQKSAELYDRVLANNPSYAPALIGRGDQLWAAGNRQGAVQLYRRVVDQLGTTGTYGSRAQSRIEEARGQPEEPAALDRAAQPPAKDTDPAPAEPAPKTEVSENPTNSPVDDTESDE